MGRIICSMFSCRISDSLRFKNIYEDGPKHCASEALRQFPISLPLELVHILYKRVKCE